VHRRVIDSGIKEKSKDRGLDVTDFIRELLIKQEARCHHPTIFSEKEGFFIY